MCRNTDWTLPDNSLNLELCYKDHFDLIENGNMKFSKLIIETLQDVLSPQSSQSSSSYLSQSSLIRSPPPSSLTRSNLLSAQPLPQSSSSQSLSATATPFNPKHQTIFHDSPTAPPKSQTLTANITCRTPRSIWIDTSGFTGKDNNEIASCMHSCFTFFIQL